MKWPIVYRISSVAFIKRVGKDKCKNRMNWVKEYSEVSIWRSWALLALKGDMNWIFHCMAFQLSENLRSMAAWKTEVLKVCQHAWQLPTGMAQSKTKINTKKRHMRLIVSIYKKRKKIKLEISKLTSHRLILPPSDSYAFQREAGIHWGVVWSFSLTHLKTVERFVLEWNDA